MPINHYQVLGLNGNGLNEAGQSYTTQEIDKAYRHKAVFLHPDRNKSPQAVHEFKRLVDSHAILHEPSTREKFDYQLVQNPKFFEEDKHIFLQVPRQLPDSTDVPESRELAIWDYENEGIDLTELMFNAKYSPEQIIALCKQNPTFAKVILNTNTFFTLLSAHEQLEVFVSYYQHLRTALPEFSHDLMQLYPELTLFINVFMKQDESIDESARFSLNFKDPVVIESLLKDLKIPVARFNFKNLFDLSTKFRSIIDVLLEHYSDSLRPIEISYLLKVYPEEKEAILAQALQHLSDDRKKLVQTYFEVKDALENIIATAPEGKTSDDQLLVRFDKMLGMTTSINSYFREHANQKKLLGSEIFSLLWDINAPYLTNLTISATITNELDTAVIQQLSPDEFDELFSNILRFLYLFEKVAKEDDYQAIAFQKLFSQANTYYFWQVIKSIKRSVPTWLAISLLNYREKNNHSPLFLKLLLESNHEIINYCLENPALLCALLDNQAYIDSLKTEPVYEMLFQGLVRAQLYQQAYQHIRHFPIEKQESLHQFLQAHQQFDTYLPPEKEEDKEEDKKPLPELTVETFKALYAITGWWPKLLSLKTKQGAIIEIILTDIDFSVSFKDLPWKIQWNIRDQIKILLTSHETLEKRTELVGKLLAHQVIHQYFLELIHDNYFTYKELLAIEAFGQTPAAKKYLTGHLVKQLAETVLNKSYLGDLNIDHYKTEEYAFLQGWTNKIEKTKNWPTLLAMIELLSPQQLQHLRSLFPKNTLLILVSIVKGQMDKVKAYDELMSLLDSVTPEQQTDNAILMSLVEKLRLAGLDAEMLTLIMSKLAHCPMLQSAMRFMIEEGQVVTLSAELATAMTQQHVSATGKESSLQATYLAVAKVYIDKYRHRIPGDELLALTQIHGKPILSVIRQYGLEPIRLNAEKLKGILTSIPADAQFIDQAIQEENLVKNLLNKFNALLTQPIDQITNSQDSAHLYAEIVMTQERIKSPLLECLLTATVCTESHNSLLWAIKLVIQGNLTYQETVINLLNSTDLTDEAFDELCQQLATHNIDETQLKTALNEPIAIRILARIAQQQPTEKDLLQNHQPVEPSIVSSETVAIPRNEHPSPWEKHDQPNTQKPSAIQLRTWAVNLFRELELKNWKNPSFDALLAYKNHNKLNDNQFSVLIEDIKRAIKVNCAHLLDPELDYFIDQALNNKLSLPALITYLLEHPNALGIKDESVKRVVETSRFPININVLNKLYHNNKIALAPLFSYYSSDVIAKIYDSPLKTATYQHFITNNNLEEKDDKLGTQLQLMNDFFDGPYVYDKEYYKQGFLIRTVFKPIEKQIKALENKKDGILTKAGKEKAEQLKIARDGLITTLSTTISHFIQQSETNDVLPLAQQVHRVLLTEIEKLVAQDFIGQHRNYVKDFFRGLLGVLLALPLGFTPLFSKTYRDTFFNTKTQAIIDSVVEKAKSVTEEQLTKAFR